MMESDDIKYFEKYINLVNRPVYWACKKHPSFGKDELLSAAHEGLWNAVQNRKYNDGRLTLYVQKKIFGAIQDYIRRVTKNRAGRPSKVSFVYIEERFRRDRNKIFSIPEEAQLHEELTYSIDEDLNRMEAKKTVGLLLKETGLLWREKEVIRLKYSKV